MWRFTRDPSGQSKAGLDDSISDHGFLGRVGHLKTLTVPQKDFLVQIPIAQ